MRGLDRDALVPGPSQRVAGGEFALACDLRFASRERAVSGHPEVGTGLVPRRRVDGVLPALAGRSRALEIIVGSEDFDADTGCW